MRCLSAPFISMTSSTCLSAPLGSMSFSTFVSLSVVTTVFVLLLDELSEVIVAMVGCLVTILLRHMVIPLPKKPDQRSTKSQHVATPPKCSEGTAQPACQEKFRAISRRARMEKKEQEKQEPGVRACEPKGRDWKTLDCPEFSSDDWTGQVKEVLDALRPTDETARLVLAISLAVQDTLRCSFPEAVVVGVAHANPNTSKSFSRAVPDIEIVAFMKQKDLIRRLGKRYACYHVDSLQKIAIRTCTDKLASLGEFKFRRSGFKQACPKVTLQALPKHDHVPFSFTVNGKSPLHQDELLKGCAQIDPRVRDLVLLVLRWARDRGLSYEAKGNLPPYAWTAVVIFFAQVRVGAGDALLPAFDFYSRTFLNAMPSPSAAMECVSVASLFTEFMQFYAMDFDWLTEAIGLQLGRRSKSQKAQQHDTALWIGDPFDHRLNVASSVTEAGMVRLQEEFARAHMICSEQGLLSALMQPWVQPESPGCASNCADAHGEDVAPCRMNVES